MEKTIPRKTGNGFPITVLAMLALVLLGRGVSYFHTVTATDIAYAAWVPALLSYLAELLVCARTVLAIAGVTYAVCRFGKRGAGNYLAAAAAAAFLDYAARFLIDFATSAIVGAEVLAVSWLLMQFLFEMLFVVLAWLIADAMKKKHAAAETRLQAAKYTVNRSCMVSVLLVMLSRIVLEVWYLVDFLLAYTDVTAAETAAIVGSFLKVIVIYGGAAVLIGECYTELLKKLDPRNVKRD